MPGARVGREVRTDDPGLPYPATSALLVITAALTPAYFVRWHISWYPTTALEMAVLVTVAAFLLESLRRGELPAWWSAPLTIPTLVFLAAGAVAVLHSPLRVSALGLYRAYIVEPVAIALVMVTVVRTVRQARAIVAGFWVGGAVLAIANIDAVMTAVLHDHLDVQVSAPVALYTSANSVAMYLVPLVALAAGGLLHSRERSVRVASGAFLVIGLSASVLSYSRGGWLAIGAAALVVALSHRLRWWLLGGITAAIAAAAAVPSVRHRVLLEFQPGAANTADPRLHLYMVTLRALQHDPILGTGLAGLRAAVIPLWGPTATWGATWWILYAHNLALSLWAELGLGGLLSFAWIFAAVAFVSWHAWRHGRPEWRALHVGVLGALAAIFVHGLVDTPYFKNDLALEFWALAALSWAGRARPGDKEGGGLATSPRDPD
ncbi:MAG: O-antigen ligase family protein [Acidimicrobiaceae bacterium]|nr:O-antigen ligase family protein [Acidimicrobiaceae bacterium]